MAELSQVLFVKASTRVQTWFLPQRMKNAVMMWAVLNGLAGYQMFWLAYRFHGRTHDEVPAMWGTEVTRNELMRKVFLGLLLYAAYYVLLFAMYFFFRTRCGSTAVCERRGSPKGEAC
jgi:hypothetical protein